MALSPWDVFSVLPTLVLTVAFLYFNWNEEALFAALNIQ
jgi:hypothetical protein